MHGVSAGVLTVLFMKQVRAPVSEIVNGMNNCYFHVQYVHYLQQQTFSSKVWVYVTWIVMFVE